MSGIADAIRLREFTNRHPQLTVSDVGTTTAPIMGETVQGLYVCQVGRIHRNNPKQLVSKIKYDLSWPDLSEIGPIEVGPWNQFETTYDLDFPTGVEPIDKIYTSTSHRAQLPVGAKSPPSLESLNPLIAHPFLPNNNSRDWNKISEKL